MRRDESLQRNFSARLRGNFEPVEAFEFFQEERGLIPGTAAFVSTSLVTFTQRLAFTGRQNLPAGCVFLHTETPVLNTDQGDELTAIIFDKEQIVIADLKLRCVAHLHRPVANSSPKHPD